MDPTTPPTRRSRRRRADDSGPVDVDVVVIGAGGTGLAAAHDLHQLGVTAVGTPGWQNAAASFVVLDDHPDPGGSWSDQWAGLTVAAAHSIPSLPDLLWAPPDREASARDLVPRYFRQYEAEFGLPVLRPVHVDRVRRDGARLAVSARHLASPGEQVTWRARGVINATGNRSRPFWPTFTGQSTFGGRQLHSRDYPGAAELGTGHVVVVGGGSSAVHILADLAQTTSTTWVTRRPPQIDELDLTPEVRRAAERGRLVARPLFERIGRRGVWFPAETGAGFVDGPAFVEARTIVWATGFRPAVAHLAPLRLRLSSQEGLDGPEVIDEPCLQLVGASAPYPVEHDTRLAVLNLRSRLGL